jgi:uncharacterized protein (DUF58 family)
MIRKVILTAIIVLFAQAYFLMNLFPALIAFSLSVYLLYVGLEFDPKIEARRTIPERLYDGEMARARLFLKNLRKKDYVVKVKERLPEGFKAEEAKFFMGKAEEKVLEYSIVPSRGVYRIKGPEIIVEDIRGVFSRKFSIDSEQEVEVLPSIKSLREEARIDTNIRLQQARSIFGHPSEFESLRKFQEGDDARRIDWKASARLGELIVREFLKEWEGDVYIAVDIGREMRKGKPSKLDYATVMAYQLAVALKDKRVGLILYDEFGIKKILMAMKDKDRLIEEIKVPRIGRIQSLRFPKIGFERTGFLRKIPLKRYRLSFIGSIPQKSFVIFITDLSTNAGELLTAIQELKNAEAIIVSPNPILFSDLKLERDEILKLYKRYLEREEFIRRMNRFVPTIDVGPRDLLKEIEGAIG